MRQFFSLVILGIALSFLLNACSQKEQSQTPDQNKTTTTTAQAQTQANTTPEASASTPVREETIRWITAGIGDWENDSNWEDTASKAHRLPNEQDIVFVPKTIQGRTVSVQIADTAAKTVKKLINEGEISGHRGEKNPTGSLELRATETLINKGQIQGEPDPNGQGGSVMLNAKNFENLGTIESGETNKIEAAGGSVTIEAEIFVNKGDVRSARSEMGDGGPIQISAKRLTNYKRVTAARTDHVGSAGGSITLKATDYFSQYEGARITAGRSHETREEAPPSTDKNKKKEAPKISYYGKGGSIAIQAKEVNIFDGRLTAGEGNPKGELIIKSSGELILSSSKPVLDAYTIKLVAQRTISLLGLKKDALKSTAPEGEVGIMISTCDRIDLQNNKGSIILTGSSGATIQFAVPQASQRNILLDSGITLGKLSKPQAQLVAPTQSCG
jgi:hypothetical protein